MNLSMRGDFLKNGLGARCRYSCVRFLRRAGGAAAASFSFRQVIATLTLACFVTSFIAGDAVAAVLELNRDIKPLHRVLDDFLIPRSAGRITDAKYFGTSTVVVNIQDLHCHPEVQRNIGRILSRLDQKYHIPSVYLEGAFGSVDTSWLASIGDPAIRQKVLDSLIDQGKLTGVEYYSVAAGRPDAIRGIENRELYVANSRRLGELLNDKAQVERILDDLDADIRRLRETYYNARQAKLEKTFRRYSAGAISAKKYYALLRRYAGKLGIDIREYRDIVRYLATLEQERSINYRAVARQLQEFVLLLKQRLPYAAYSSLLRETDNFSKLDELYAALPRLADDYQLGTDVNRRLPELARFFNYLAVSQKVNPLGLVGEERKLLREIEGRLATDQGERDAAFLVDFFAYFREYFGNRISADDYGYFREHFARFVSLWSQYVDNGKLEALEPYCALLNRYYDANEERNTWFLKYVLGEQLPGDATPDLSPYINDIVRTVESLKGAKDIKVVVTGGFHTAGLAQLLARQHISYLVITPNVTGDTRFSDAAYARLAKEQRRILSQTFALLNLSQHPFADKARDAAVALMDAYLAAGLPQDEVTRRINEYFQALRAAAGGETSDVSFGYGEEKDGRYPVWIRYRVPEGKETVTRFTFARENGKPVIVEEMHDAPAEAQKGGMSPWRRAAKTLSVFLIAMTLVAGNIVPGTRNVAQAAPYTAQQLIPGTPLYRSFQPQEGATIDPQTGAYLKDFANTYDQALVVISALGKSDLATARGILSYFQTKVAGVPRRSNKEQEINTGEVVWTGIAAARYTLQTGDRSYEDLLRRIDLYVFSRQQAEGYVVGGPGVQWASTEHNLDALAYLTLRLKMTEADNNAALTNNLALARSRVAAWLIADYDAAEKRFNAGLNDPAFATDTSAWGVAVLAAVRAMDPAFFQSAGLGRIDLNGLLAAADARSRLGNVACTAPDGSAVTVPEAYRFEGDNPLSPVSMEFSAHMALAYRLLGNENRANAIIAGLQQLRDKDGNVPYALSEGQTFRNGGWQAHTWLSIAATEWLGFAAENVNPFLAGSPATALQPLKAAASGQDRPAIVIPWKDQGAGGENWRALWSDVAPVDISGMDTVVVTIKDAKAGTAFLVQLVADPATCADKGVSAPLQFCKGGRESIEIPLWMFADLPRGKEITRVVITCGQTAFGRKINPSNENSFETESIEFRQGAPQSRNVSLFNRIGMAVFVPALAWAVNSFLLANPLVLLAAAPFAGYYLLQAAFLIRAEWRRSPPAGSIFTRISLLAARVLAGEIRAAWVEEDTVRTDEELLSHLPGWLGDVIRAHEERHLAFRQSSPRLSGMPLLEEMIVSLMELPAIGRQLLRAFTREASFFLGDERGMVSFGGDGRPPLKKTLAKGAAVALAVLMLGAGIVMYRGGHRAPVAPPPYTVQHQIPGTPLYPSFRLPPQLERSFSSQYFNDFANTYDQALVVISVLRQNDLATARGMLTYFQSGNGVPEKSNKEREVSTGEAVWIGLAAARYAFQTGDRSYEDLLRRIDDYILANQQEEGYVVGGPGVRWASTEHNLDVLAYLTLRLKMTAGDNDAATTAGLASARSRVAGWLLSNYDVTGEYFGKGENDRSFATDTSAWGVAVLSAVNETDPVFFRNSGLARINFAGLLAAADAKSLVKDVSYASFDGKLIKVPEVYRFEGNNRSSPESAEFSAQMALAYRLLGNETRADAIVSSLSRLQDKDGNVPYALTRGKTFEHGGWEAFTWPSIAATEWLAFAADGFNPFFVDTSKAVPPLPAGAATEKKTTPQPGNIVIQWRSQDAGGSNWLAFWTDFAKTDISGRDTLVINVKKAPGGCRYRVQIISDPATAGESGLSDGAPLTFKGGKETVEVPLRRFPGIADKKAVSRVVITCGQTAFGEQLNGTNENPVEVESVEFGKSLSKNLSLANRIGMAAFTAAAGWAVSCLLLANPLVLAAFAPAAGYYLVQAAYLIRAEWRRGPPAGVWRRIALLAATVFSGRVRVAWVEGGEVRVDAGSMPYLPEWLQDAILAHEERHLAFRKNFPLLSGIPFIEEMIVSLLELPAVAGSLGRAFGSEALRFLADERGMVVIGGGGGENDYEIDRSFDEKIVKWAKDHRLFLSTPPYYEHYRERDFRLHMSYIRRDKKTWTVKAIKERIEAYPYRNEESRQKIRQWIGNLEASAARFGKDPRLFLASNKGPLAWVLKPLFIEQERQGRERKLFAAVDIRGVKLYDLPLWPVDNGVLEKQLVQWMGKKKDSPAAIPPYEYYARDGKLSLNQLRSVVSKEEYEETRELLGISVYGRGWKNMSPESLGENLEKQAPGQQQNPVVIQGTLFGDEISATRPAPGKRPGGKKGPRLFTVVPPIVVFSYDPALFSPVLALSCYAYCCSQREKIIDWLHLKGYWRAGRIVSTLLVNLPKYSSVKSAPSETGAENVAPGSQHRIVQFSPDAARRSVTRNFSSTSRLAMASLFAGLAWAGAFAAFWIAATPFIVYYAGQGVYLIAAELNRRKGERALAKASVILGGIFAGKIRAGWTENDAIMIDEDLVNHFPGGDGVKNVMRNIVIHHEQAHQLFRFAHPRLSSLLPMFLEEFYVSLAELRFIREIAARNDNGGNATVSFKELFGVSSILRLKYVGGARRKARVKIVAGGEKVDIAVDRFPDGELYQRVLNPEIVEEQDVAIAHPVHDASDIVEIALLADLLRRHGAARIQVVIDRQDITRNGIYRFLRYCCDSVAYDDDGRIVEYSEPPAEAVTDKRAPQTIRAVLYQHYRIGKEAAAAAAELGAKAQEITIVKHTPNPFDWDVRLPGGLAGEDVELIHSDENDVDFVELWMMLVALRQAGVNSISLLNTYEGYSRADKIFKHGEGINAITMLKLVNAFVDNHYACNVHYGGRSGNVSIGDKYDPRIGGYNLYNINALCPVAEKLFEMLAQAAGKENLERELKDHPIILVAPDDGAFGYVDEARDVLKGYIRRNYGIDAPVYCGYMNKVRISPDKVSIPGVIFGKDARPLEGIDLRNCWAFVLDDETSKGSTLKSSTYALVKKIGLSWPRVLSGVAHGKFAAGLEPFKTGLNDDEIDERRMPRPEYVNDGAEEMPPRLVVTTESVQLPRRFPQELVVPISALISYASRHHIAGSSNLAGRTAVMAKKDNIVTSPVKITAGNGELLLERSGFPDGDLYFRIAGVTVDGKTTRIEPKPVQAAPDEAAGEMRKLVHFLGGREVTVRHPIANANDLVEIILLVRTLKDYGAAGVVLVTDHPTGKRDYLYKLLRRCCDRLMYADEGGALKEIPIAPAAEVKKRRSPRRIDFVLYQHRRLKNEARKAAAVIYAHTRQIDIFKNGSDNPLYWDVTLPAGAEGKDVELIHSTENNGDFAELWLMLVALREAGVRSVSLINTYEGYSRADKIFKAGEGVNAVTMLGTINAFVDYHCTFNVHYGDNSGWVALREFKPYDDGRPADEYFVDNLNAFCQVAEQLFENVVRIKGEKRIAGELQIHPLLLVGPDKGSAGYVREARDVLQRYIRDKYGIATKVHWGHMKKVRLSSEKVVVDGNVYGADGKPLHDVDLRDCWAFVLDDETSFGSTLMASTYALVRKAGLKWPRILTGVVHGKLTQGLRPFETGLRDAEIGESSEPMPEYVDNIKEIMPPRSVVVTGSVKLPIDFPRACVVPLNTLITHATKRIIGTNGPRKEGGSAAKSSLMAALPLAGGPALDWSQAVFMGASLLYVYCCTQRDAIIEWLRTKGHWRAGNIAAVVFPDLSAPAVARFISSSVFSPVMAFAIPPVGGPSSIPPSRPSSASGNKIDQTRSPENAAEVTISREGFRESIAARALAGDGDAALQALASGMARYDGIDFAAYVLSYLPVLAAFAADIPLRELAARLKITAPDAEKVKEFARQYAEALTKTVLPPGSVSNNGIGSGTAYGTQDRERLSQKKLKDGTPFSRFLEEAVQKIAGRKRSRPVFEVPADVLTIGGGTGTGAVLRAVGGHFENIQSLVCSVDNGGSSGSIMMDVARAWEGHGLQLPPARDALPVKTIVPPGDFMSAVVAGIPEDWKRDFCSYRLTDDIDADTAAKMFDAAKRRVLAEYAGRLDRGEFDRFFAQVRPLADWIDREWVGKRRLRIVGINHSIQNMLYLSLMLRDGAFAPGWVLPSRYTEVADNIVRLLGSRVASLPSSYGSFMDVGLAAKLARSETLRIKDKDRDSYREVKSDVIYGQENITGIEHQSPIESVALVHADGSPAAVEAPSEVLGMISRAKMIVIGPGSMFTSILPHLLVKGVVEELAKAKARGVPVVFLFNATQDVETYRHTPQSAIEAMEHSISGALGKKCSLGDFVSHLVFNEPVIDGDTRAYLQGERRHIEAIRDDPSRIHEIGKHTLGLFENTDRAGITAFLAGRNIAPVIGSFADFVDSTGRDMKPVRSYRYVLPLLAFFFTLLVSPATGNRCIAADLDETLAEAKAPIPGSLARQIALLLRQGHKFSVTTGNQYRSVLERVIIPLRKALGPDSDLLMNVPIVDNNGAQLFVYRPEKGEYEIDDRFTTAMPRALGGQDKVETIREIIRETIAKYQIRSVRGEQVQVRYTSRGEILQITFVPPGLDLTPADRALYVREDAQKRSLYAAYLNRRFQDAGIAAVAKIAGNTSIDITPVSVDKALAIGIVAAYFGMPPEEIIYFGDSFMQSGNDYPAARKAGTVVNVGAQPAAPMAAKVFQLPGTGPAGSEKALTVIGALGTRPQQALGFGYREFVTVLFNYLMKTNRGNALIGELRNAAIQITDYFIHEASSLHGSAIEYLPEGQAERYAPAKELLCQAILREAPKLREAGVLPDADNVAVRVAKGKYIPVGNDGKDLGVVTMKIVEGKAVFIVTEAFMGQLQNRAPPEIFTLLARHELDEHAFLKDNPDSAFHDFHKLTLQTYKKLFAFAAKSVVLIADAEAAACVVAALCEVEYPSDRDKNAASEDRSEPESLPVPAPAMPVANAEAPPAVPEYLDAIDGERALLKLFSGERAGYMALVDVDKMRDFNNLYGKQIVNFVIEEYLAALHAEARNQGGFVTRWGGDEWIVYLPPAVKNRESGVLEQMRRKVTSDFDGSYGIATVNAASVNARQLARLKDHALVAAVSPLGGAYIVLFKAERKQLNESFAAIRTDTGIGLQLDKFNAGLALAPYLSMGAVNLADIRTRENNSAEYLKTVRAYLGRALEEAKKTRDLLVYKIIEGSPHQAGISVIDPSAGFTKSSLAPINTIPDEDMVRREAIRSLTAGREVTVIKILPSYRFGGASNWSRFKDINSTFGYLGGDEMIQLIYGELREILASAHAGTIIARSPPDEFVLCDTQGISRDAARLHGVFQKVVNRINANSLLEIRFDVVMAGDRDVRRSFNIRRAGQAQVFQRNDEICMLLKSEDPASFAVTDRMLKMSDERVRVYRYDPALQGEVTQNVQRLEMQRRGDALANIRESRKATAHPASAITSFDGKMRLLIPGEFRDEMRGTEYCLLRTPDGVVHLLPETGMAAFAASFSSRHLRRQVYRSIAGTALAGEKAISFAALKNAMNMSPDRKFVMEKGRADSFTVTAAPSDGSAPLNGSEDTALAVQSVIAAAEDAVTTVVASPLNPGRIQEPAVRMGKESSGHAVNGRQVVLVTKEVDPGRLYALQEQDVSAYAISLGAEGRHLFNVEIPVPGRVDGVLVNVRLQRQEVRGVAQWVVNLDSEYANNGDELRRMLVLGRGALAVLQRLQGDRPQREQLDGLLGAFVPAVVEIDGSFAAFAHPDAVRDAFGSGRFDGVSFVYAADNGRHLVPAAGEIAGLIPGRYRDAVIEGEQIDVNKLGMILADRVAGDAAVKKTYPEIEGILFEKGPGIAGDEDGTGGGISRLYLQTMTDKRAGSAIQPFGTVTEVVLPSACRKSVDDPGIGKLNDVVSYAEKELGPAGATAVQLGPLAKPVADSPFVSVDSYAGDDQLVDWMLVTEVRKLLKNGELSRNDIAAPEDETDAVNRESVARREYAIAGKALSLVMASPERRAGLERFEKANTHWLFDYAEKMAAARVLGMPVERVTAGDIDNAKQGHRADFENSAEIYRLAQWQFDLQLRSTLLSLHMGGYKAFCWVDITPRNYRQAERILRYWLQHGFDGVRINITADADNNEILNERFLQRMKSAVSRVAPEAVVSLRMPKGTGESLTRRAKELGFYNIRRLGDILAGGKSSADEWVEIDSPESLRPHLDPVLMAKFGRGGNVESFYRELAKSEVLNDASYISFMIGTLCGDDMRLLWTDPSGGEHFNYRLPLRGDARYRLDLGRKIAAIVARGRGRTLETLYQEGYVAGLEYTRLPAVNEDGKSTLRTRQEMELTDGNGVVKRLGAPGLHVIVAAGAFIRQNRAQGMKMFADGRGDLFFDAVFSILDGVDGMDQRKWPSGWGYLKAVEKRLRFSKNDDEKIGCLLQAAGFIRAIEERMAEAEYRDHVGRLMLKNEQDDRVLRTLLSQARASGISLDEIDGRDPRTMRKAPAWIEQEYRTDAHLAALFDILNGGSRDLDPDAALKEASGVLDGADAAAAILYARALIKIKGEEGRSAMEIEAGVREALNPLYGQLLKEGLLTDVWFGRLSQGENLSRQWVTAELISLFELFAESDRFSSFADRTKDIYKLFNGAGVRGISSAG